MFELILITPIVADVKLPIEVRPGADLIADHSYCLAVEFKVSPKTRRRFIREKTARNLIAEFTKSIPWISDKPILKPPLEIVETEEGEIYQFNNIPIFVKTDSHLFPTLYCSDILKHIPKVAVNAGAIPFICNGADVMAPGIVQIEGKFRKGEVVIVIDEHHRKPLAVTKALYAFEVAETMTRGKVLKNIHYVGDELWKIMKQ